MVTKKYQDDLYICCTFFLFLFIPNYDMNIEENVCDVMAFKFLYEITRTQ